MSGSGKTKLTFLRGTNEISIDKLSNYIAVVLEPAVLEPPDIINFSEVRRAEIKLKYEKEFENASMSGELVGRDPHTKIEQPLATGDELKQSVVFVDDLREYLSKLNFIVEVPISPAESGRYTLVEAAITIARETEESETLLLNKLKDAVRKNLIPVHGPGSNIPYQPSTPRDFYEEVYWDDLNRWIGASLPRITWRFPPPLKDQNKPGKKFNRTQTRINEIIRAVEDSFSDPMNIPEGGKTKIRKVLCKTNPQLFKKDTFDSAWKMMRKENIVRMENNEKYILGK